MGHAGATWDHLCSTAGRSGFPFMCLLPLTVDFGAVDSVKRSAETFAGIKLPGPCLNYAAETTSSPCFDLEFYRVEFPTLQMAIWAFGATTWGWSFINSELIQSCNKDHDYSPRPFLSESIGIHLYERESCFVPKKITWIDFHVFFQLDDMFWIDFIAPGSIKV